LNLREISQRVDSGTERSEPNDRHGFLLLLRGNPAPEM
jgi:hypothetical protein